MSIRINFLIIEIQYYWFKKNFTDIFRFGRIMQMW